MPYKALQEIILNNKTFLPGQIIPEESMRGYYPATLTRLELAEFVRDAQPITSSPEAVETSTPTVKTEEVFTSVEETKSDEPIRAEVSKHGVWYKVFAGPMQIGKPTRDEKQAKKIAKEFNAKL